MPFFHLGHKLSLPNLQQHNSGASKSSKLRSKFARSQLFLMPSSVTGTTLAVAGDNGSKQSFFFPELYPPPRSTTHLNTERAVTDRGRDNRTLASRHSFSSSDCEMSTMTDVEHSSTQLNGSIEKSTSNLENMLPRLFTSPLRPSISLPRPALVQAHDIPTLSSSRRGPLASHPVSQEELHFLARLYRRVRPSSPSPKTATAHPKRKPVRSMDSTPDRSGKAPLMSSNRATRLIRTPTPHPSRSKRGLPTQTRLHMPSKTGGSDVSSSHDNTDVLPCPLPTRLSVIPEISLSQRGSAQPSQRRMTLDTVSTQNTTIHNTTLVAPNAPRMRFSMLARSPNATHLSPPPPPPPMEEEDSSSTFTEASVTSELAPCPKRMAFLACSSDPVDSVCTSMTALGDAWLDETDAEGYDEGSGLEFLGYGEAMMRCGEEGCMRLVSGGEEQRVKRCIRD